MPHLFFLSPIIDGAVGGTFLLSLIIIVSTFFMEDATTVVVGMLAADGIIPVPVALLSLYAGVVLGDTGFYTIGRLARRHSRLAKYVDHDLVAPIRSWLETRFILTVFSARFIPGARLPTYATSGFFHSPFPTFLLVIIAATSIWTTALFSASYWLGSFTSAWMGPVRWGIAIAFLLALFFIGRHNVRSYRAKRDEMKTSDDTRAEQTLTATNDSNIIAE